MSFESDLDNHITGHYGADQDLDGFCPHCLAHFENSEEVINEDGNTVFKCTECGELYPEPLSTGEMDREARDRAADERADRQMEEDDV